MLGLSSQARIMRVTCKMFTTHFSLRKRLAQRYSQEEVSLLRVLAGFSLYFLRITAQIPSHISSFNLFSAYIDKQRHTSSKWQSGMKYL